MSEIRQRNTGKQVKTDTKKVDDEDDKGKKKPHESKFISF